MQGSEIVHLVSHLRDGTLMTVVLTNAITGWFGFEATTSQERTVVSTMHLPTTRMVLHDGDEAHTIPSHPRIALSQPRTASHYLKLDLHGEDLLLSLYIFVSFDSPLPCCPSYLQRLSHQATTYNLTSILRPSTVKVA